MNIYAMDVSNARTILAHAERWRNAVKADEEATKQINSQRCVQVEAAERAEREYKILESFLKAS
jgi:hypothetical protein